MQTDVLKILEYDKIKQMLADLTQSGLGRELAEQLEPLTQLAAVEAALQETTEARALLAGGARVPLSGLTDAREWLARVEHGGILGHAELVRMADCLRGCRELKRYMEAKRDKAPSLSRYAEAITPHRDLEDEIYASVDGTGVASAASPRLAKIRKEIKALEDRIQARLQSFLTSAQYREALQESFVSLKEGRYVLPVKASQKHKLDGLIIDTSGSGSTVFIEPAAVRKLSNELQALRGEEEAEEYQVLAALSGLLAAEVASVRVNLEIMAAYDFALAKGRLSEAMQGRSVGLNGRGFIQILKGRHPLLPADATPLELTLGRRYRTLVITGPNTGGKTVALKTVGLLTLMAQSGLHVPVCEGSHLAVFQQVLADIGDGQSIEQSLSTFSSHMGRIAAVLRSASPSSLVLLDEVGTGTDPAEGSALAMAILEELHEAGGVCLASTHYSDVKHLAESHDGFINGRMDFDPETLRPLYRLVMGEAGSSHAFWIAERLGLGQRALERANRHLQRQGLGRDAAGPDDTVGPGDPAPSPSRAKPPEERILPAAPEERQPAGAGQETAGIGASPAAAGASPAFAGDGQRPWQIGDSVLVESIGQQGVVAELPDARGQMVIFTRGKRVTVNHKRVKLLVAADHLYPEGYDMRVALYTFKDRKLIHDMERKLTEGYRIISEGSEDQKGRN